MRVCKKIICLGVFVLVLLSFGSSVFAQSSELNVSSIVKIENYDEVFNISTSGGSGTIISKDGLVLTNYHVVEDSLDLPEDYTIYICLTDNVQTVPKCNYEAEVLEYVEDIDLALLQIVSDKDFSSYVVDLGATDVEIGENLNILGFPISGLKSITLTKGIVSGFLATDDSIGPRYIKTDAALAPGNSGGAAFDEKNQFVGVPTFNVESDGESLSYIISNYVAYTFVRWAVATNAEQKREYEQQLFEFVSQEHELLGEDFFEPSLLPVVVILIAVIIVIIAVVVWVRAKKVV